MRKIIVISCAVLAMVLGVAMVAINSGREQSPSTTTQGVAQIGGAFTLEDTNKKPVHDTDFMGKWMLVYFGFTYCPDVCPLGLATISQVMTMLGEDASKVQPLFITLDPERDTPEQLKSYLSHFNDRIIGLTGSAEQVKNAAAAYRVYHNKVAEKDSTNYLIDHSAFMYLMDTNGNYVTHFAPDATVAQIAGALKKQIQ